MNFIIAGNLIGENVKVLKSEVSKTAYQGVLIAIAAIVIATSIVSYYSYGVVSLQGIIDAQKNNMALWVLDSIPFIFGIWGQYSGSMLAHQAGVMVFDQTQDLRSKAEWLEKQTNHISTHDPVTDLPNRALFYDRVERAIIAASNHHKVLSILLIEIENFKDVHDALGRNNSDLVLRQIAVRLQGVSRYCDSIAKIDGNVFGLLMGEIADFADTELLAKNIHKALEPPFKVNQLEVTVHADVGIVHFPEHGEDVDTLVQRAGVALRKAQGTDNGYAYYDSSDGSGPHRITLLADLRNAIGRGGLELHYQAKVSVQTGKLFGAEALVRWNHPVHGVIFPDEFIALAERTRMIKPLTLWVLKQAFQDCVQWRKQGLDLKISVNLSPKDLHDPELPDIIAGVAASTAIKPDWIMLEITEGSVMSDPESALEIIQRLHRMGFQFSIDDFGTGYSSLAYLKKMPLTELKIDKSFVMDILQSEQDATIVNTIIHLAHNLGLHVTAEGVEDAPIMAKLKGFGCDLAQGYYLNKPLPVKDFNNWINQRM